MHATANRYWSSKEKRGRRWPESRIHLRAGANRVKDARPLVEKTHEPKVPNLFPFGYLPDAYGIRVLMAHGGGIRTCRNCAQPAKAFWRRRDRGNHLLCFFSG